MNGYISKSYTTTKNAIDRQYTERAGAAVVSTITSNYLETIQCKELLRKTAKTCQFTTKRYFKNELKHSKRFDHVTDDVMSLFWS